MRSGLKKPVVKAGPSVSRGNGFDPGRELRAKATPKHHNINRFGIPSHAKIAGEPNALSGELVAKPARAAKTQVPAAAPLPSLVTSVSHQKLERMLDQALTHADSHKQAARYHAARHFWQRRWLGNHKWLAAGVILIVLAAAFTVSWQKVPALSVKAAGLRAHVHPSVPTYIPDGYQMAGPAQASSGTVSIRYASPADETKSYEIIQAQSNLTSQLVEQSVVPKGAPVQTSQVEGNTVYIYGRGNDAAWVNNGVLYTINDQANLSSDELIKIVQGLN